MPTVLAAVLACLLLTTIAAAQETPDGAEDARTTTLFLTGMMALTEAEQVDDEAARRELYDEAIEAFRAILVNRPELVRVRLELARTFFLKGQDGLARRHFEAVLAGGVPPPVALNVRQFLAAMRARKRWTGYFGAAVAPDSNLNAASETEIVYLDTVFGRLPFERQGDIGVRSGLGLSVWGGGEYQRPLALDRRLRLRAGADASVREYPGSNFDQTVLAAYTGPRLLLGPITDVSLLGTAHRQWLGGFPYIDEVGTRLELDRQLLARLWARGTVAWRHRDCLLDCDWRDGFVEDYTLSLAWTAAPVLRVQLTVGYMKDYAELEHWRSLSRWVRVGTSLALPLGFTLGASAQMNRMYYDGEGWRHATLHGRPRRDRIRTFSVSVLNRAVTLYGFSPQLALIHEARLTNAQAQDYDRNRAELRFVRQF